MDPKSNTLTSEQANQDAVEQPNEPVSKRISDRATERMGNRATKKTSGRPNERPSKQSEREDERPSTSERSHGRAPRGHKCERERALKEPNQQASEPAFEEQANKRTIERGRKRAR